MSLFLYLKNKCLERVAALTRCLTRKSLYKDIEPPYLYHHHQHIYREMFLKEMRELECKDVIENKSSEGFGFYFECNGAEICYTYWGPR
jgi:hypothetical protein